MKTYVECAGCGKKLSFVIRFDTYIVESCPVCASGWKVHEHRKQLLRLIASGYKSYTIVEER